jgi:hypothetical protein
MMKRLVHLLSAMSVVLVANLSAAGDFPSAPPNMKEMESQGLPRLSHEELKGFFPGAIDSKGTKGHHILVLKPDGSVDREGFKDLTGKWRIDEGNNAYCLAFNFKKGYKENCFAVFRAADGTSFFDYDIGNGFYAHVWRRAEGQ